MQLLRTSITFVKRLVASLIVALAVTVTGSLPALAANTNVQATVSGNTTPILQVTSTDGSSTPPTSHTIIHWALAKFAIHGTVNNLVQIQVEVDGQYSTTVPLTPADTAFDTTVTLTPGTHTITLVGISADGSTNPTTTLTVDYTPAPTAPVPAPPTTNTGGVFSGVPISSSITTASNAGLHLPQWVINGLIAINVIVPGESNPLGSNVWRIILIMAMLAVIIWAQQLASLAQRRVKLKYLEEWIRGLAIAIIVLIFLLA